MRVSDLMVTNNYIGHFNDIKEKMSRINEQILTGKKISRPSDSPVGTSKLLRISTQLGEIETFRKNVQNSLTFLDETILSLESMQSEVQSVLNLLTDIQNPLNQKNLDLYADTIEGSLDIILDLSNTKSDGKYIFGGTDYSSKPYGYSADLATVETLTNTNGNLNVRFTSSITQKINLTGTSLFGTVVSFGGTVDVNAALGSTINNTQAQMVTVNYVQKSPDSFSRDFVNALAIGQGPDAILISADLILPQKNKLTLKSITFD